MDSLQLLGRTADEAASRVASIQRTEIDGRVYLEVVDEGPSAVLDDEGRVRTIHLYSSGHQGYRAFTGVIPSGVRLDMTRDAVRATLGQPQRSGGAARVSSDLVLGGPWDVFGLGDATIHVEYRTGGQSVALITLRSVVQ